MPFASNLKPNAVQRLSYQLSATLVCNKTTYFHESCQKNGLQLLHWYDDNKQLGYKLSPVRLAPPARLA